MRTRVEGSEGGAGGGLSTRAPKGRVEGREEGFGREWEGLGRVEASGLGREEAVALSRGEVLGLGRDEAVALGPERKVALVRRVVDLDVGGGRVEGEGSGFEVGGAALEVDECNLDVADTVLEVERGGLEIERVGLEVDGFDLNVAGTGLEVEGFGLKVERVGLEVEGAGLYFEGVDLAVAEGREGKGLRVGMTLEDSLAGLYVGGTAVERRGGALRIDSACPASSSGDAAVLGWTRLALTCGDGMRGGASGTESLGGRGCERAEIEVSVADEADWGG